MSRRVLQALLLLASATTLAGHAATLRMTLGGSPVAVPVRSLLEIRDHRLVRQGWDTSCGAAALSTVLTHEHGAPYSELSIAVSMLANTDPRQVRARGGFSLLDLKRFAEAVGFEAEGYGGLDIDDLAEPGEPAILPVRIRGLDHFVVFRHRAGSRVLVADPAFGNLVIPERQFLRMWRSGIALFVAPANSMRSPRETLPDNLLELAIPDLGYAYRVSRGTGALPSGRP